MGFLISRSIDMQLIGLRWLVALSDRVFLWALHFNRCPHYVVRLVAPSLSGAGMNRYIANDYAGTFRYLAPLARFDVKDRYVSSAQFTIATLYINGPGNVPRDTDVGLRLMRKAAENGSEDARQYLQSFREVR